MKLKNNIKITNDVECEVFHTACDIIDRLKKLYIQNHNGRRPKLLKINKDIYQNLKNFLESNGLSIHKFLLKINLKVQTINEREIKLL